MTDEKKPAEPSKGVTLYVDELTIANASASANAMIQAFVKEFSKSYGEKAAEVDRATNKGP
jgi:hypothetical protein